jgi:hypothetical protein
MTLVFAIAMTIGLIRAGWLHVVVSRYTVVGAGRAGNHGCELRRKVQLVARRDASGTRGFPVPQETRLLVQRCVGLPWRIRVQSVGLPAAAADRIRSVEPEQFDSLFAPAFRSLDACAASPGVVPACPPRHG